MIPSTFATSMKILFYSPLKSPNHPVPSGDRLMARLFIQAFQLLGHDVAVASEMRSFMRSPEPQEAMEKNQALAEEEIERIFMDWSGEKAPDLWFTYHPYYKAPDLLGPKLAERFGIPLVNAEASYSNRRNIGSWKSSQDLLLDSLRSAAVTLCMTRRDMDGLQTASPNARLELFTPFIDSAAYLRLKPDAKAGRLVTVAMMRPGDKLDSYRALAESLSLIDDLPWTLSIAGDGECREDVMQAFSGFDPTRVEWLGALDEPGVAQLLSRGSIFVWPGHGEAYGLAYLEAQAAGLPVIAEATAGVPEVVEHGRTGLLTEPRDRRAFAAAIARLLCNDQLRSELAAGARSFATEERSIEGAAERLRRILERHLEKQ